VSSDVSRAVGARCDRDDDCDERCLLSSDYPDGFCSVSCDDDDGCPDGAVCVADDGGICKVPCAEDQGCEFLGPEWMCLPHRTPAGEEVKACRGR
jgi:hypothetical protein